MQGQGQEAAPAVIVRTPPVDDASDAVSTDEPHNDGQPRACEAAAADVCDSSIDDAGTAVADAPQPTGAACCATESAGGAIPTGASVQPPVGAGTTDDASSIDSIEIIQGPPSARGTRRGRGGRGQGGRAGRFGRTKRRADALVDQSNSAAVATCRAQPAPDRCAASQALHDSYAGPAPRISKFSVLLLYLDKMPGRETQYRCSLHGEPPRGHAPGECLSVPAGNTSSVTRHFDTHHRSEVARLDNMTFASHAAASAFVAERRTEYNREIREQARHQSVDHLIRREAERISRRGKFGNDELPTLALHLLASHYGYSFSGLCGDLMRVSQKKSASVHLLWRPVVSSNNRILTL